MARTRTRGMRTYMAAFRVVARRSIRGEMRMAGSRRIFDMGRNLVAEQSALGAIPPIRMSVDAAELRRFLDGYNGRSLVPVWTNASAARILTGTWDTGMEENYQSQQRDRDAATQRAWATLRHYLSADEQAQMHRDGYLVVASPSTPGRVYHVPGHDGLIGVYEDGRHVMDICVRPVDATVPWPDVMLAYKLGIEGAEQEWLAKANRWYMRQIDGGTITERHEPGPTTDYFVRWWRQEYAGTRVPTHQVTVDMVPGESPVVTARSIAAQDGDPDAVLRGRADWVEMHQETDPARGGGFGEVTMQMQDGTTLRVPCADVRIDHHLSPVMPLLHTEFVAAPRQLGTVEPLTIQTQRHTEATMDVTLTDEMHERLATALSDRLDRLTEQAMLGTGQDTTTSEEQP